MERAEKQSELETLDRNFKGAQIAICAHYQGLTVSQITSLRKKLHSSGVSGKVVKNTLASISAKRTLKDGGEEQLQKFLELFSGPSFLVFAENDPVTPAKLLTEFGKENTAFKVKGAWFENSFLDVGAVDTLSKLPSREENLAKLLALLNTPATQLLRLMQEPAARIARLLGAFKDKLESAGK